MYHVNTETGEMGKCRAVKGMCPFGETEEKYETLSEARTASERILSKIHETISTNHKNSSPLLSELVDTEKFQYMIDKGFISTRVHKDDPNLRIYCYTPAVQFQGLWTPETKLARGLIMNIHGKEDLSESTIEARGLSKFFTVDHSRSEWGRIKLIDDDEGVQIGDAIDVDMDAPAYVANKLDGALGVMYIDPKGNASIATKGSFTSLEAEEGSRLVEGKHNGKDLGNFVKRNYAGKTLIFETITTKQQHVVNYGNKEDTVLLGTIDNRTGFWTPSNDDWEVAKRYGFETAQPYEAHSLGEALALPYDRNHEGVVVTVSNKDGSQSMFKVKYDEYLSIRKIKNSLTKKSMFALVKDTKPADLKNIEKPSDIDFSSLINVPNVPEAKWIIDERKKVIFDEIVKPIRQDFETSNNLFKKMSETADFTTPEGLKDFAKNVFAMDAPTSVKKVVLSMKTAVVNGKNPEDSAWKSLFKEKEKDYR